MSELTAEELAISQRATDPRLDTNQEPPVQDQSLIDELPADPTPVEDDPEPEPVVKPKRTAEEVLKGRVGHLTKTLSAKDQELIAAKARAEAAETLLASQATQLSGAPPIEPVKASGTLYTQADFDSAVAARAEIQEFNRKADEMYTSGFEKFPDWKDAVDTLVASGFMNKDLLDVAMAVEDGPAVIHHLGMNLDEAERINALSPIRKATEISKISNSLSTPKKVPISSAPTPIKPVNGSPSPSIDLQRLADEGDMAAYLAARAKQGSIWANARR